MSAFYLLQSQGYFYCLRRAELLTSAFSHVGRGDDVAFKLGSKTMSGNILFESDKGKDILEEIKRLKTEKKSIKRESSFDGSRKRKAALKADEVLSSGSASRKSSDPKKEEAANTSLKRKKDRVKAVEATETLLMKEKKDTEGSGELTDEDNETSASDSSSIEMTSSEHLNKCNFKDAQSIKKMEQESDSNNSEINSTLRRSFRVSSDFDEDLERQSTKKIQPEEEKTGTMPHKEEGGDDGKNSKKIKTHDKEENGDGKDSKKRKKRDMDERDDGEETKKIKESDKEERQKDGKDSRNPGSKTEGKEKHSKKQDENKKKKEYDSEDAERSESKSEKKNKDSKKSKVTKHKSKKRTGKRNETIYDGVNYKLDKNSPGVTQLNSKYEVYVLQSDYDSISSAQSAKSFVTKMIEKVYTKEALKASTPRGFPPRGKGRETYKNCASSPMLHPDGLAAIIAQAITLQETTKSWRPKRSEAELMGASRVKCSTLKRKYLDESSSDSSSSSNSSSSDDE